jgi:hypothetical protein
VNPTKELDYYRKKTDRELIAIRLRMAALVQTYNLVSNESQTRARIRLIDQVLDERATTPSQPTLI